MSERTTAEKPSLTVGKLYKVTNPTSEHFGKVGSLLVIDGGICWVEFIDFVGPHHTHSAYDFGASDVEPYVFEDTEPQALVSAVETPRKDGPAELTAWKALTEVQTNQAEHAAHLDQLAHRADLERAERAADRMRLNSLAQEVKELRENAAADRLLIRNNAEQVKECFDTIEAHRVWLRKIKEAIDAMHYRRMVGNLFRRVADAVDGG